MMESRNMQSIRTLLAGIIDYAGLFPPASLSLAAAAENYARYCVGPHAWMLGRFIIPANRLTEFAQTAEPFVAGPGPWTLSALCTLPLSPALEQIRAFQEGSPAARVDTIEVSGARPEDIGTAADAVLRDFTAYFEIPLSSEPAPFVRAIAAAGARAKMRTGGVTPESIPDAGLVARFVRACAAAGVPYKATAGLHHPLRGDHNLAPDAAGPRAGMHGFLNVFLASAFARNGAGLEQIVEILGETSLAAFRFDAETVAWRGREVPLAVLLRVRQRFAIAFGSCSFEEPVEELRALALI
jgi:hypothetical protein